MPPYSALYSVGSWDGKKKKFLHFGYLNLTLLKGANWELFGNVTDNGVIGAVYAVAINGSNVYTTG